MGQKSSKNRSKGDKSALEWEQTEEELLFGAWPTDALVRAMRPPGERCHQRVPRALFDTSQWTICASLHPSIPLDIWSDIVGRRLDGLDVLSLRACCRRLRDAFPFDKDRFVGDMSAFVALGVRKKLHWLVSHAPELAVGITRLTMGIYTLNTKRDAQISVRFLELVAPTLEELSFQSRATIYNGEKPLTQETAKLLQTLSFPKLLRLGPTSLLFNNYNNCGCTSIFELFGDSVDYSRLESLSLQMMYGYKGNTKHLDKVARHLKQCRSLRRLSVSGPNARKCLLESIRKLPALEELAVIFYVSAVNYDLDYLVNQFLLRSEFRGSIRSLKLQLTTMEHSRRDQMDTPLNFEPKFPPDFSFPELLRLGLDIGWSNSETSSDFSTHLREIVAPFCPKLTEGLPTQQLAAPYLHNEKRPFVEVIDSTASEMRAILLEQPLISSVAVKGNVTDDHLAVLAETVGPNLDTLILECANTDQVTDAGVWTMVAEGCCHLRFLALHDASHCTHRVLLIMHAYLYRTLQGLDISAGVRYHAPLVQGQQSCFDDLSDRAHTVDLQPIFDMWSDKRDFLYYWKETTGIMWTDECYSD